MKEGVDDEEEENSDEGLDGGGTCSTSEMTELTTWHVDLKDSASCMYMNGGGYVDKRVDSSDESCS